jgi:hypothetical protein
MNVIKNFLVGIALAIGLILVYLILGVIIWEMPIIVYILIAIAAIIVIYVGGYLARTWRD